MGDKALDAIAVLADDLRRRLFDFVRANDRPVSRDEAAAAAGISRKLAAFHLDRLVAAGLLHASYGSPDGVRRVGRAPKHYRVAELDICLSIPPRRPELLAEILLDAITDGAQPSGAVLGVARRRGIATGEAERAAARPGRLGAERALTLAAGMLERGGFEPVRENPLLLRLRNCPFHPLVQRAPDLVCGLNHAFVAGMLDGLGAATVNAALAPTPGMCCVELRAATAARTSQSVR